MSQKNNIAQWALTSITSLLVLLWVYTVCSKLVDVNVFKRQLLNQNFNNKFAEQLFWILPIAEIGASILLLFAKTRQMGLLLSAFMMLLFTGYIGLVLLGFYEKKPCSCGGVLTQLSWPAHFWFNLFFLLLTTAGLILSHTLKAKPSLS